MHTYQPLPRSLFGAVSLAAAVCVMACGSEDKNSAANSTMGGGGGVGSTDVATGGAATNSSSGTPQAGASTGSGGSGSGGTTTVAKAAPVGTFSVTLKPANAETGTAAYTLLQGIVRTGAMPEPKSWTVSAEEAGCQLVIPNAPLCDPKCPTGQTCVEGGTCVASPTVKSVGSVTVKGVKTAAGETEFVMEPASSGSYSPDPELAYPPFEKGANVEISAAGGEYAAFSLSAKGIEPLADLPTSVAIETGKAASIQWNTAGANATSTIEISLDISQHGGTKGVINCSVADNGAFDIPATLITQLINLGVAGFPMISIARKSVGSAELPHGRVDLLLTSALEVPVEIPGLTSCSEDIPCPSGMSCQSDYTCK